MNGSTALLAGSLLVNATLIGLFVAGSDREKTPAVSAPETGVAPSTAPENVTPGLTATKIDPKIWANLHPTEFGAFYDRLRAAGLSPTVARMIVTAQVRAQFSARRAALNRAAAERPFWEPVTPDRNTAAALTQLTKEENRAIRDALGPDALRDENAVAVLRRQFPTFSETKIDAIQRLRESLNETAQEFLTTEGGEAPPELVTLMKEHEVAIARLLTPQEREEYDLRASSTALTLRQRLTGFDPTEQEFRALFALQSNYAATNNRPAAAVDLWRPTSPVDNQLVEEMKSAIGEQRYADFLRSNDASYQQTARLMARLELPPDTADHVYAVQKEIQQRATTLEINRALTPSERNAQLSALAAEAQTKVISVLGPRGFEAYKQYGGSWLTSLQSRAAPPRN